MPPTLSIFHIDSLFDSICLIQSGVGQLLVWIWPFLIKRLWFSSGRIFWQGISYFYLFSLKVGLCWQACNKSVLSEMSPRGVGRGWGAVHPVLGACTEEEGLHDSLLDRCYLFLKVVDALDLEGSWNIRMECFRGSRTLLPVFYSKMDSPVSAN